MTPPKYKTGRQIRHILAFENIECDYFRVKFGSRFKTVHRSFLESWQYRTLKKFITEGRVYGTERTAQDTVQDHIQ